MFILEVSTVPKFPARPGINILQNLYKWFNYWGGGRTKTHENFVKYGYNF